MRRAASDTQDGPGAHGQAMLLSFCKGTNNLLIQGLPRVPHHIRVILLYILSHIVISSEPW